MTSGLVSRARQLMSASSLIFPSRKENSERPSNGSSLRAFHRADRKPVSDIVDLLQRAKGSVIKRKAAKKR
jgi:hypothetical protein